MTAMASRRSQAVTQHLGHVSRVHAAQGVESCPLARPMGRIIK